MLADLALALVLAGTPADSPAAITRSATCAAGPARTSDGTRRFWTSDRHCYRSPWFRGAHRLMIGFGCTAAPYYAPSSRCSGGRGFHHGIDIDMPQGTVITSAVSGRVVLGTLGRAYGSRALLLRTAHYDIVLGHLDRLAVRDGQRVIAGQLLAWSGQRGAPDGPHLHFEVRPRGASYSSALDPRPLARLRLAS